jgi:RNA polymerase sigma-70 factor (ECF subfamily)
MITQRRYRAAVAGLPEPARAIFLLHRREGLSYEQIAALRDLSIADVEQHIAEAIYRLLRALDDVADPAAVRKAGD